MICEHDHGAVLKQVVEAVWAAATGAEHVVSLSFAYCRLCVRGPKWQRRLPVLFFATRRSSGAEEGEQCAGGYQVASSDAQDGDGELAVLGQFVGLASSDAEDSAGRGDVGG